MLIPLVLSFLKKEEIRMDGPNSKMKLTSTYGDKNILFSLLPELYNEILGSLKKSRNNFIFNFQRLGINDTIRVSMFIYIFSYVILCLKYYINFDIFNFYLYNFNTSVSYLYYFLYHVIFFIIF